MDGVGVSQILSACALYLETIMQDTVIQGFEKTMAGLEGNIMKLSIIIPVYNEAMSIIRVITQVQTLPIDKEIIIVDDGSTDGTGELLDHIRDIKVLHLPRNRGKGYAMQQGIEIATGDYVIVQDADLEYLPEDIILLLRKLKCDK